MDDLNSTNTKIQSYRTTVMSYNKIMIKHSIITTDSLNGYLFVNTSDTVEYYKLVIVTI